MKTHRRTVTLLAGPGIHAARHVYTHVPADAIRVAALVEIAAAPRRWPAPWSSCAGSTLN